MENIGVETKTVMLDYSALTSTVTESDRDNFLRQRYELTNPNSLPLSGKRKRIAIGLFACIPLFLVLSGSVLNGAGPVQTLMNLLFSSVAIVVIGWIINKAMIKEQERRIRLTRFATANGLVYKYNQAPLMYRGMIFDKGHSRKLEEQFVFNDNSEIGNYTYVTGSGKNSATHTYGYVRVKLERRLPHMVLDAKHNNFLAFSNLPDSFNKSQAMSMEGNFDEYYTLYAPNEYKRDALYVFTPDVMAALIDSGAKYDMEVIDDSLFIYHTVHFDLASQAQLEGILKITQTIASELRDQTEYYSDERISDRTKNIIAPQGVRLKKGINFIVMGGVLLFFANFVLGAIYPKYVFVANTVIGLIFWGFVISAIVKSVKRR